MNWQLQALLALAGSVASSLYHTGDGRAKSMPPHKAKRRRVHLRRQRPGRGRGRK